MAFLEYRFAKRYFTPRFCETKCETIAKRFSYKSFPAKDKIRNDYRFVALRRERFVSLSLLRGETKNETTPAWVFKAPLGEWLPGRRCTTYANAAATTRTWPAPSFCIPMLLRDFSVSGQKQNRNNRRTGGQRRRTGGRTGGEQRRATGSQRDYRGLWGDA